MNFTISVGNSRKDKYWKEREVTWDEFCKRLSQTTVTSETQEEYKKMKKYQQDDIKDIGGFVAGKLKGGRRRKESVINRSMLTLDLDYADDADAITENIEMLYGFTCCIYSTHKHTPEKPRLRLIVPLDRTVTPDEYQAVSRWIAKEIGIEMFDDTTYEPNRLMYWPSTSSDGEFFFRSLQGDLLSPDSILGLYEDWKDSSTWPVSSRQHDVIQHQLKRQADPMEKKGTIGAFCRSYGIEEAIEKLLSDIYTPSIVPERYDYIPADSSAGVVIHNGKYAYSHHATDPACGKLCNAFDLVRIHRFSDLDDKLPEDTSPSKLPSFKAMNELALEDERVKEQLAKERLMEAEDEFTQDNWQVKLELEKNGSIKNTLRNLTLIIENDPNIKSIVFNQLSDSLEIKGEVPWKHPTNFWRDADDAQLISYVDTHYGTFSARNYDIAVMKVADDRSYHPILEFIADLPKWDETPRVDTLLIDYLGAKDNPYVRTVTRKTLCAAISRVLNPGIKFDTMLVLTGPQGAGKSTLIAKLGGEWFSDSLNLSDTKDKTAAEKLQGYWILEIGELAGLKKAEEEMLRSFLSRQNDIYRASFGRRATPHLRQCVFFGTTNAEKGYLRDTAGNRRFWPVKVPGNGNKHTWDLTQEDILQIWAEALTYVKAGETLHLDPVMEHLAKEEQREAMESDEREGLVRDFLDMLLPEEWSDMDLYERRAFINGTEFGDSHREGVYKRESVSNMEIWCECFGKDRANLNKRDSAAIATIMASIGGWSSLDKRIRIPLYGPQWIYVLKA